MAKIKDIRYRTSRTNGTRSLSAIKYIARHHSATTSGDFNSFWRTWNGVKGWGTGGYHEIILRDGTVELCYDPHEITNGVGGHNSYTYHICVVGNGSFTPEQERVFDERCRYNMARLNVPVSRVLGHKEFKGASTACPGINMDMVRRRLAGKPVQASAERAEFDYSKYRYGQPLMKGMGGAAVRRYQQDMNALGYKLTVDGSFGPASEDAAARFQADHGLIRDGIVGVSTQERITDELAKLNAPKPIKKEEKPVTVETRKEPLETHRAAWEWAEAEGLLNGERPADNLSREQYATVLKRQDERFEKMVREIIAEVVFGADRDVSASHRESWEKMIEAGMTNGERPGAALVREQMASILDRAGLIPEKTE